MLLGRWGMGLGFCPGSWFGAHTMHEWLYFGVWGGRVLADNDAAGRWAVDGSGVNFGW